MGICSSKSSASPASKKAAPLPAAGAKKVVTPSAPAQFHPAPPADDSSQLKFVPAKDDAHAVEAMGAKPPVELSVAAQPTPMSDAAARATSTARVEEVVLHTTKPSLPADDGGAAIRRAPPPAPTVEPSAETSADRKAEWERVRALLPREKTPEDKQRRIDLFDEFDKDKSGALTYDEVHQACIDILHLDHFTPHLHDITKRAFNKAKDMGTKDRGAGEEDKVEFLEFRLMLCYIYDYFELTVMFDEIDKDGSMMIDKDEFISKAAPMLIKWGVPVHDADATFNEIDANGSKKITFAEFAAWATEKKLDVDGDPDAEATTTPTPIAEDAQPITFSDDSEPANDGGAAADDDEDDDADGADSDLDPRRVYGFDGDSTGLGAGAKEEGVMTLDDDDDEQEDGAHDDSVKEMSGEDKEDSEAPMVPVVVRAAKVEDVEMGHDENGVEARGSRAPLETSAPRAVSLEAAEEAPMVPVVVQATKNQEVEMGEAEGVEEDAAISAPRAVSLEAAEQQPTPSQSTADAIQQNIIDDLFGDEAAQSQAQAPAPRRLPPPMPSPGERSDKPDDEADPLATHETHTSTNTNDAGDAAIEEVVATPPPVRRAPPPMFSPPPPDADSEAENSVGAGVEAFYGRGTDDQAAPAPQDTTDDAEKEEKEDTDEL